MAVKNAKESNSLESGDSNRDGRYIPTASRGANVAHWIALVSWSLCSITLQRH
jgi:hypothetical protein